MTNKNQSVKMRRLISLISILLVMVLLAACSRGELPKDNTGIENSSSENLTDENNSTGGDTGSASNETEKSADVLYFQDLLTNEYWYWRALSCTFEKPEDISLRHYFCYGLDVADRQKPATFTDDEKQFLKVAWAGRYGYHLWSDAIKLPVEKFQEALSILKVTGDFSIPRNWVYYEETDAYYMPKMGSFGVTGVDVTEVVREADKTVRVYWKTNLLRVNSATGEYLTGGTKMVMILQENADGTYIILSNVPESSIDPSTGEVIHTEDSLDLPNWNMTEIPYERNACYRVIRYQAGRNHSDYDTGYEGKRFTTDGMQDGRLYAVDDGEIYTIAEKEVACWEHDYVNKYIYFVLKDDARKVWRTDQHGNELTLIYESQHGDISWVLYNPLDYQGRLLLLENNNRGVFYNLATQKVTVILEAYYIDQLSYLVEEQYVFWKGQLNKDVPSQSRYWDTYKYYVRTGEYKMLVDYKNWVTVKPTGS